MQINLNEGEELTVCAKKKNGWITNIHKFKNQDEKVIELDLLTNEEK